VSKRGFALIAIIALVSCAGEAELYQRVQFGGVQNCPFPCTSSPTPTAMPTQTPGSLGNNPRISALRAGWSCGPWWATRQSRRGARTRRAILR